MRTLLPDDTGNARPFDPHDRPRVGEWVRCVPSTEVSLTVPEAVEPLRARSRHVAETRQTGAVILFACVAALVFGALGFVVIRRRPAPAVAAMGDAQERKVNFVASLDDRSPKSLVPGKPQTFTVLLDATPRESADPVAQFDLDEAKMVVTGGARGKDQTFPLKAPPSVALPGGGRRLRLTLVTTGEYRRVTLHLKARAVLQKGASEAIEGERLALAAYAQPVIAKVKSVVSKPAPPSAIPRVASPPASSKRKKPVVSNPTNGGGPSAVEPPTAPMPTNGGGATSPDAPTAIEESPDARAFKNAERNPTRNVDPTPLKKKEDKP